MVEQKQLRMDKACEDSTVVLHDRSSVLMYQCHSVLVSLEFHVRCIIQMLDELCLLVSI